MTINHQTDQRATSDFSLSKYRHLAMISSSSQNFPNIAPAPAPVKVQTKHRTPTTQAKPTQPHPSPTPPPARADQNRPLEFLTNKCHDHDRAYHFTIAPLTCTNATLMAKPTPSLPTPHENIRYQIIPTVHKHNTISSHHAPKLGVYRIPEHNQPLDNSQPTYL